MILGLNIFDKRFEIREHSDFVEDNLTGLNTIEYSIPSGSPDGINDPEYWKKLEKLANRIRQEPNVTHAVSYTHLTLPTRLMV